MTRAEKIRQMDDTELADALCDLMPGEDCHVCKFCEKRTGRCKLVDWLQEEVKEKSA